MKSASLVLLAVLVAMPTIIEARLREQSRAVNLWSARPATNLAILKNNHVIVAARNKMVLFNENLEEIGEHRTCDNTTPGMCKNDNKVMILNKEDSRLVACGSGKQGKCEVLEVGESNFTVPSGLNDVRISTDINRPAVGCITENGNFAFGVTNGDGINDYPETYAISKRKVSDLSHFSGARFKKDFANFIIYYKDVIQIGNYSYFVTNLNKNGITTNKPLNLISKVARMCTNDGEQMTGYVDFEIGCTDQSEKVYNLIQHVTKTVIQDGKTWIFGVFTSGDDAEKMSGDSIVCATTLNDVNNITKKTWDDFIVCPFTKGLQDTERYFKDNRIDEKGNNICVNELDYKESDIECDNPNPLVTYSYNIGVKRLNMTFKYRVESSRGFVTAVHMTQLSPKAFPVLLLGTSKGELIMTNYLPDDESIQEYDSHTWKQDVGVRSIQQKDDDTLYILRNTRLHDMQSSNCSEFTTCKGNVEGQNPLCGWCVLENKATRYEGCGKSENEWLPSIHRDCPSLTLLPDRALIGTSSDVVITVTMTHTPVKDDGAYKCVFSSPAFQKNYEMPATRTSNSVTCLAPKDVMNHTNAMLEVWMSDILLASSAFMFYDCNQFKKCGDCLASPSIQCTWDTINLVCGTTDTGLNDKSSCPMLLENKLYIPSGQTTPISLTGKNLADAYVYKCQVGTKCEPATMSGENINCNITLQSSANKTEEKISVKYGLSPDVSCENMISMDNFDKENTGNDKENTGNDKENTGNDKENTGNDKENTGNDKENTGNDMENTGNDKENTGNDKENTVTVYNCKALADGDCSICCALNHGRYKCTWNEGDCVYASDGQCNTDCPAPQIQIDPRDGPTHGGTILTLTGKNFGHWTALSTEIFKSSEPVKIIGVSDSDIKLCETSEKEEDFDVHQPDEDFTKAFPRRIVCTMPALKGGQPVTEKNVTLTINGETSNEAKYLIKIPKVTKVLPRKGPIAGGTRITLIGENFRIGNVIVQVKVNNAMCTDVKVVYVYGQENSNITCLTGQNTEKNPQNVSINISMDRDFTDSLPYQFADSFEYVANPIIEDMMPKPLKGILSGGNPLSIIGQYLDNANQIVISSSEDTSTTSSCHSESSTKIICPVPKLSPDQKEEILENLSGRRRKRSADGKGMDCVEIPMSIKLDGITHEFTIEYCRDPELEKFNDGVLVYASDDKYIKIRGEYLTLVAKETDFKVTVGLGECKIIELKDTEITCNPPDDSPENPVVNVTVGNIQVTVGRLEYSKSVELLAIIAGVSCGVVVIVVIVVVLFCYKRNVKKQAKKYEGDLKNMEMEIIDVARQEFLDMHTAMSSVNRNLVEQGFPYHTYQQYACNVMFAVDYLWTEPVVSNSKMTDDERLRANKGMEALESLIYNKFFLVSVINSLEKQKKFFIREKSNLAGNLCAVLMGKMDYLNEVLCMLMKNMVQDSSGKKAQQKALFRRCEKLTEKLLSNWMSLCLYPHFMSHSGSPLYLLYIALQKTIEAGPIDAETGDAKYTLSEEKLLKQFSSSTSEESLKFESKTLTLNVVVNEGEEIFKCKVLDCDTISQVKSKCLSQIYVNFPASKLDVDPDELILEWHEGFGGSLKLQDHDNTSSQEGSWVRLNTLAHYNVKDESNLALVDPHSAEVMQQEDYVNLTQINMEVGGCNGSMDSTDPLTTPAETHDELQYWHLVKKEEESSKKEKSAIAELYLNRLFTTKMSLKDYIKTMFDIILDKDNCPPPAKFLLNYLDDLGEQFKVDNDTIHGWKSHSYAIRVWAALMKLPSLLFDVNIPHYMTDNLEVISQVFIESFSLSSQKFTKDSPSQKLIFHNEMLECRERALEFYKNVKVDTQDHEELRKYLIDVNKLQQQTDFNKTSALYRFYKQTKPYLMDIVEDLATSKETKDLQLDKKLEKVMQIMEEEEDDD